MAARFETQFTIVLSTWSASNTWLYFQRVLPQPSLLVIFEGHPPNDPWVKSIRIITVDTKSISPCRGTKSIHLTHCSSYNLRVTQSCELPMPSSGRWTPSHHHRAQDECVDKEENSECVSRRRQLVAAAFSAGPPSENWLGHDNSWKQLPNVGKIFREKSCKKWQKMAKKMQKIAKSCQMLPKVAELAKNGKSWQKLAKKRETLAKAQRNWLKLAKIGNSLP